MIVKANNFSDFDTNNPSDLIHRAISLPITFLENGQAQIGDNIYSDIPSLCHRLTKHDIDLAKAINGESSCINVNIYDNEWTMDITVYTSCPEEVDELPAAVEFLRLYQQEGYEIYVLDKHVQQGTSYTLTISLVRLSPALFSFIILSFACRGR